MVLRKGDIAMSSANQKQASGLLRFDRKVRQGDFEFWQANSAPFCDVTPIEADLPKVFFQTQQFFSKGIFLNHCRYGAKAAKHTQRHADQVGGTFRIQRFQYGGMIGHSRDTPFNIRPGMVALMDQARTFEALHSASLSQGVYIPKALLDLEGDEPVSKTPLRSNSTMARVLHAELDRHYDPLLAGKTQVANALIERFVACVRMAIYDGQQEEDVRSQAREALRDLICDHVERNLQDPDLGSESLLKEFGVSRAGLYRMFESEGGVRNYISNRRLFRAVHMISTNPMKRGQVTKAAEKWGFQSPISFNRSVKRTFGTSPGSLFQQPLQAQETPLYSSHFERFITRAAALAARDANPRRRLIAA